MMTKIQKIKNLIINLIVVLTVSLIGIFSFYINPSIYNSLLYKGRVVSASNSLIVHYISVGQGDAIAINLPDGKIAVVDTGLETSNVYFTNYLKEKVCNVAKDNTIDYLILSHADADHSGGALRMLQQFDVENIVLPYIDGESENYKNLLKYIEENDIFALNLQENLRILENNYSFEFYFVENFISTNDMSHVVKLEYLNKSFLFTGDISSEVELELVKKYGSELNCDVLKVAHHGSKYSTCEEFLNVATPSISVISCGKNSYGHPTSEVIENLEAIGSKIYRTDTHGNVAICVGEYYNLNVVTNNYKIISIAFKIELLIVTINLVILCNSIAIFIKKGKRN